MRMYSKLSATSCSLAINFSMYVNVCVWAPAEKTVEHLVAFLYMRHKRERSKFGLVCSSQVCEKYHFCRKTADIKNRSGKET